MIAPTATPPLRGIVLRDDRDTLVIQASEVDVQRYAQAQRGRPVNVAPAAVNIRLGGAERIRGRGEVAVPPHVTRPRYAEISRADARWLPDDAGAPPHTRIMEPGQIDPGDYLYDREGRPVCTLRTVDLRHDRLDVTTFGDPVGAYVRGEMRIELDVAVLPGVTLRR